MIRIKEIRRYPEKKEIKVYFYFWSDGNSPFIEFTGFYFFKPDNEFDPENDNDYLKQEISKFIKENL